MRLQKLGIKVISSAFFCNIANLQKTAIVYYIETMINLIGNKITDAALNGTTGNANQNLEYQDAEQKQADENVSMENIQNLTQELISALTK